MPDKTKSATVAMMDGSKMTDMTCTVEDNGAVTWREDGDLVRVPAHRVKCVKWTPQTRSPE
jgi:hypothetical protein